MLLSVSEPEVHSRCSHSKWSWTRERSLPVPASVSSASCYLRLWPSPIRILRRGAPGQVGSRRMGAMVSVCRQGRWPLCRITGQYLRFRTKTLVVGTRRGWGLLRDCARTSAFASANCTVPAAVPSARTSVSASVVPPWKSPHPVRLVQNTGSLSTRVIISLHAVWNLCSFAAFRLMNQQQQCRECPWILQKLPLRELDGEMPCLFQR